MNKLHGSKEKRGHYLRQGGPKTSPNTGFAAHFAKPEMLHKLCLLEI